MKVHFEGCPAYNDGTCTCRGVGGLYGPRLFPNAVAFLDEIIIAIEEGPAHPRLTDAVVMAGVLRDRFQREITATPQPDSDSLDVTK